MTGMFPSSGVPWSQAENAANITTENCPDGALFNNTARCQPRFDPASQNAIISEIGNAVNNAGLSYDCTRLDNLAAAIRNMVDQATPCGAPEATPAQLAQIGPSSLLTTCIDDQVVSFPASQILPTPTAITTPCNATTISGAQQTALAANPSLMFMLLCMSISGTPSLRRLDGNQLRQILLGDLLPFLQNNVQIVTQRQLTPSAFDNQVIANTAGRLVVAGYPNILDDDPPTDAVYLSGNDFPRHAEFVAYVDVQANDVLSIVYTGPLTYQIQLNGSPIVNRGVSLPPTYFPPATEAPRDQHFIACYSRRASDGTTYPTLRYVKNTFGPNDIYSRMQVFRLT